MQIDGEADRQTDSHDKANICFRNFAKTPKMAQDGDRWWAVLPAVMNLLVP